MSGQVFNDDAEWRMVAAAEMYAHRPSVVEEESDSSLF